ncbi:guanine nucleotide binding protein (G protein) alpha v1 isoform X1 [Hypanus sabinus]|uniref:guanine nucleotide binding protein (G protein) alpha v1 isoform X1 n=1 Tax=Hypanus sabinus TaxID=79690 RepID=UPI0028C4A018|nr:guanine nucleotide binding protein (G protein) alpha v1 isoform X1 [Hypanus sabinus]
MGLCLGSESSAEERQARLRSDKIDRALYEYAKQELNVVKILLLGAAESGKSTLVKQMKIIHSHGFTEQELTSFKPAVLDNLLSSMKFVLQGMGILRINLANPKNTIHAQTVLSCGRCFDEDSALLPFVAHALRCLWADPHVKLAASRGYEFELNDSAHYFFLNMNRITAPEYKPTQTDILRVRLRTSGVIETQFKISSLLIRLYDVGGQRTERRKWISCFEDVRAVLFVAALSGYDMSLLEEPSVNRLQESLRLFSSICNNIFFRNTSMILFLNKIDLFQEKILHSERHLRLYFTQYRGANCDVDSAARYIASQFLLLNRNPAKLVYHHFTTATDTSNIQVVFQVVIDTIVKENLEAVSLL